ncbi:hypothetical protein FAZ15_02715 [Sphingobacterium olei]|uniref:Alpha-galactosidase n=1 Tax=Sphingobacterium olei TaxID=2571155 RepID=A0A4U0P7B3_9SPHI|nr:hypothetical protein [Sphingobacterium olei]TJZ63220.1 hypothetical protein FAZ15_02715 [Sphingobacterium olei]
MHRYNFLLFAVFLFFYTSGYGHTVLESRTIKLENGKLIININEGTIDYAFNNGTFLKNTVSYVDLVYYGIKVSSQFDRHSLKEESIKDSIGEGLLLRFIHEDHEGITLVQSITIYKNNPYLLLRVEASKKDNTVLETRNISPLAVLAQYNGSAEIPWAYPKLVDLPFDNDNWTKLLAQPWPEAGDKPLDGVSHEFAFIYDNKSYQGLVVGSLEHDFWKTGISYLTGNKKGSLASFIIFGGAARPDNPSLPANYGGQDGTHDVMPHGSMLGTVVRSPLIYLEASSDFRVSSKNFGKMQARLDGSLTWKGAAPVYWNSFGVEGVLGHERIMMPKGVYETVDFIKSMENLNQFGRPVLSIDSYDQGIYTTKVLKQIGDYARERGQEIGFYCSPFSLWTWSNNIDNAVLSGTKVPLREVILRDHRDKPIPFKDGEWGAYPLDPTHPATKVSMISQIEKAHAIGAKLIKVDFVTAGSLEAIKWYDPKVRSGMQAYNYGMKLFKHLVDSIMGPDVFITLAISPMFPHQYAHTRFVSTDVHSHLRDSQPGFPHYGSTAASMITASYMGWVQGTLWPYTNMDVLVMRKFQKHPDLTEQEVKVRLISLMTMGSILGDGSDYRDPLTASRAKIFLDQPHVAEFFSNPKAFIPLQLSEGETMDQQLSFFLPGDTTLVAAFNFAENHLFEANFAPLELGLKNGSYRLVDFLTGEEHGIFDVESGDLKVSVSAKDAVLYKLISKAKTD